MKHLPGFIEHSQALKDAGADAIVCHSVNDPFVMNQAKDAGAAEDMVMLADWDASFAKAGVDADMSGAGLGVRAKRYALIAKDKEITYLEVGDPDVSGAETVLAALGVSAERLTHEIDTCAARASARSFSSCPACPLIQRQST